MCVLSCSPSCGLLTEKQSVVNAVSGDGLENVNLTRAGVWEGTRTHRTRWRPRPPAPMTAVFTIPPTRPLRRGRVLWSPDLSFGFPWFSGHHLLVIRSLESHWASRTSVPSLEAGAVIRSYRPHALMKQVDNMM